VIGFFAGLFGNLFGDREAARLRDEGCDLLAERDYAKAEERLKALE